MMKLMRKKINKKGFTLIELIVVIAILGILAIIAIPRFTGMRADANEGAVIANLRTIQTAAEVAAAKNNIEIEDVTDAQIGAALGMAFPGDFADSPKGAAYSFDTTAGSATIGLAILSATPDVYPAGGVTDFSMID